VANLGGYGVAAEFRSAESGAQPLPIRCELDGLPIAKVDALYRSESTAKAIFVSVGTYCSDGRCGL
jgi:hypothetical protein